MLRSNVFRLVVTCTVLFALAGNAHAAYSGITVFGDSLSDSGNNAIALPIAFGLPPGSVTTAPYVDPLLPGAPLVSVLPYAGGRYSNGPVWVEHLATDLGLPLAPSLLGGSNFAFGGARTGVLPGVAANGIPTLEEQVETATAAGTLALPGDRLYVVWAGSNDVRDAGALAGAGDLVGANNVLGAAVANLVTALADLVAAGARDILLANVPDIGLTPLARWYDANVNPVTGAGFTFMSSTFNVAVATQLGALSATPGVNLMTLDMFSFVQQTVANAAPGDNVTDACTSGNAFAGCSNPDDYLFWDGIHPTTASHRLIADLAFATVVPVPPALPLMAGALFALGWRRRVRASK